MGGYAAGKYAWGISDRSGFRYRLKDMREEWNGYLVGPDEYEEKHPQLEPRRRPTDPEALRDPRPDTNNSIPATVSFPTFDLQTFEYLQNPRGVAQVGTVTLGGDVVTQINHLEVIGSFPQVSSAVGSLTAQGTEVTVLTVTVSDPGVGNRFYISGYTGPAPTITLNEGEIYRFDQSDSSNSNHPLRLSTTSNGTHNGGTEYTTGVTKVGTPGTAGAYTEINVMPATPTLYYYCANHSGMGGQADTP